MKAKLVKCPQIGFNKIQNKITRKRDLFQRKIGQTKYLG